MSERGGRRNLPAGAWHEAKALGIGMGVPLFKVRDIVEELRGVSCIPLEKYPQNRKSVTCSRSFGVRVESLEELREAVAVYMTKAAERLRGSRLAAGVVTVFINTSRFDPGPQYSNSATTELAYSTDYTEELLGWALKGLERIYRPG